MQDKQAQPLKTNAYRVGDYMSIWKPYRPYKADVHELKNRRKKQPALPTLCRICGKPLYNNADMCEDCRAFIDQKQEEERNRANGHKRIKKRS